MKEKISQVLMRFPNLYLFTNLFGPRLKAVKGNLQSIHDAYKLDSGQGRIAVDLGCGPTPMNRFGAERCIGIDLYADSKRNVLKARLGFEALPFQDKSVDYLTAYDLLEHIPRYAELPEHGNAPFIYLMNEAFRVLKPGGIFLSMTPIFPYLAAFQDPTHNNIITSTTLELYFSKNKQAIAQHYGITASFEIKYQRMLGPHMIAVLTK